MEKAKRLDSKTRLPHVNIRRAGLVLLLLLVSCGSPTPTATIQFALNQYEKSRSMEAAPGDIIDIVGFGSGTDLLVTANGVASPKGAAAEFVPNIEGNSNVYRVGEKTDDYYTLRVSDDDGD